ncbi:S9 family peptidase [Paenibacillus agilis]|uniref:Prolyl oligopeptidase family serine peptidase n=1 Tax=Paenibacillus agilis TaxID=3020863 RepID=A0A559IWS0_9BACL|nr:DPP IV N-terminal domain-containing protein [Paenibacillus agilis]TVX92077.1 prolyl oligopeptidase family serine peptidase [Paenibacillus agilis]
MKQVVTTEQYAKAKEWSMNWQADVDNVHVVPHWIGQSSTFWYQRDIRVGAQKGSEFVIVNPVCNSLELAFDHARLAAALSKVLQEEIDPHQLPIQKLKIHEHDSSINFVAKDKYWTYDQTKHECHEIAPPQAKPHERLSPDGQWAAYVEQYNLYVRHLETEEVRQLTYDGEHYYEYGSEGSAMNESSQQITGYAPPPSVVWSPDSKKLLTLRLDERNVQELHIVQNVPLDPKEVRPALYTSRFAIVGDQHVPMMEVYIADIDNQDSIRVGADPVVATSPTAFHPITPLAGWSADSQQAYYKQVARDFKSAQLILVQADTGETRVVVEETNEPFIFSHLYHNGNTSYFSYLEIMPSLNPNFQLLQDDSLIWLSERDGYGHFYLIDSCTGQTRNAITSGDWNVRRLIAIDEEQRWIYFTASGREAGRDPYYQHLYRIQLDGSSLTLLTPEDAHHKVILSPDLSFIVNTYSRVDLAPVSVLQATNGETIRELEQANIQPLLNRGYQMPERFTVKAADGVTDLYGIIIKPANLDPAQLYPVIDHYYAGPQVIQTPKSFNLSAGETGGAQALAQLGFATIIMDGKGTPFRSREFINVVAGNMGGGAGLDDHVAALPQLAQLYPFLNIERVGIWGSSGGGYGAARAILKYPDTYQAAVASAGNHDQLMYTHMWGEHYQGMLDPQYPDRYTNQANADLAANLKGKLLLAHGDIDDNVHIGQTLRLADALIKADKDFDLLIMPNVGHGISEEAYFIRRKWDFFIRHLLGVEPPKLPIHSSTNEGQSPSSESKSMKVSIS